MTGFNLDIHRESMHQNAYAMLDSIGNVDIQWCSHRGYPIWNVEPLQVASGYNTNIMTPIILAKVPILDFDRRNVNLLRKAHIACHWAPVIWTPSYQDWCDTVPKQERDIDVLVIATDTGRRKVINDRLKATGLNVVVVTDAYGHDATRYIKRSKVFLNVHRDSPVQAQPQLRLSWGFVAGSIVVSEESIDPSLTGFFTECHYDNLVSACVEAVAGFSEDKVDKQREDYKLYSSVLRAKTWSTFI